MNTASLPMKQTGPLVVTEMLLELASLDLNFSDIHVEQDHTVMLRMPSGWKAVEHDDPIGRADIQNFIESLDPDWRENIKKHAISRAIDLCSCRLRVNAFQINGGERYAINVRRQPLRPVALEHTGLPLYLRKQAEMVKGLILVTGQTGAGKTTTLAAILDTINKTRSAHIVTIEDPIEFVQERRMSIFSAKEVGLDTPTFAQGMRDALRQKPDVIMVGEIRDRDTADTVFAAAESGHLVLASLHTNSAMGAINKILSWFPEEASHRAKMLADSLICIVAQTLVPSVDGSDRVLASEILLNQDPAVSEMLQQPEKHAGLREFMKSSRDRMSHSLNSELVRLVREGRIKETDAMRHTNDRLELLGLLGRAAATV